MLKLFVIFREKLRELCGKIGEENEKNVLCIIDIFNIPINRLHCI